MLQGRQSLVIAAPAEELWAILTDVADYPRWHPFFAAVRVERRDAGGLVERARCRHQTPAGELSTEVAFSYEPARIVRVERVGGDLKSLRASFELEPGGEQTTVTHELAADPGFKLGLLLRGPVADRVRDKVIGGALDGLAARAGG